MFVVVPSWFFHGHLVHCCCSALVVRLIPVLLKETLPKLPHSHDHIQTLARTDKQSATAHLVVVKHNTPAENHRTSKLRTPPTPRQQQLAKYERLAEPQHRRPPVHKSTKPSSDFRLSTPFRCHPFLMHMVAKPGPSSFDVRGCHCHEFGAPKAGEHLCPPGCTGFGSTKPWLRLARAAKVWLSGLAAGWELLGLCPVLEHLALPLPAA